MSSLAYSFSDFSDVMNAGSYVNVTALDPRVVSFLKAVGKVHRALYGIPLIITSGNDGQHVAGSAHAKNVAVDLRSHDKDEEDQMIFHLVLAKFSYPFKMAVFDERFTANPHWHVQTADSAFTS